MVQAVWMNKYPIIVGLCVHVFLGQDFYSCAGEWSLQRERERERDSQTNLQLGLQRRRNLGQVRPPPSARSQSTHACMHRARVPETLPARTHTRTPVHPAPARLYKCPCKGVICEVCYGGEGSFIRNTCCASHLTWLTLAHNTHTHTHTKLLFHSKSLSPSNVHLNLQTLVCLFPPLPPSLWVCKASVVLLTEPCTSNFFSLSSLSLYFLSLFSRCLFSNSLYHPPSPPSCAPFRPRSLLQGESSYRRPDCEEQDEQSRFYRVSTAHSQTPPTHYATLHRYSTVSPSFLSIPSLSVPLSLCQTNETKERIDFSRARRKAQACPM